MKEISIQPIDISEIAEEEKQTEVVLLNARALIVSNLAERERAAVLLKEVKAYTSRLDTLKKTITNPLKLATDNIKNLFMGPLGKLADAEAIIKRGILSFDAEQERIAREQEAKLRQAAEKEAAKLRERALKAAEKGKEGKAQELEQKAAEVQMMRPTVELPTPKIAGLSSQTIWKFEIADVNAIPREYMMADTVKIGQVARATKGTLQIPGVRIYSEKSLSSRMA